MASAPPASPGGARPRRAWARRSSLRTTLAVLLAFTRIFHVGRPLLLLSRLVRGTGSCRLTWAARVLFVSWFLLFVGLYGAGWSRVGIHGRYVLALALLPALFVGARHHRPKPHLRVHALRGEEKDLEQLADEVEPVPMLFDGRFLVRHDLIRRR